MDNNGFQLGEYLSNNIEKLVRDIIKGTLENPRESAFMARFALASRAASKKRAAASENGEDIPPFLIASITSSCNLHCAGCYSRHNHACSDGVPTDQLSADDWKKIFVEAVELGVSFVLLAGGEPLIRRDVIEAAGEVPEIMFPVFTNGTLFDDEYIKLFDKRRNLMPIFSIEGDRRTTDGRRGEGVYDNLRAVMERVKNERLIFGASVTVTTENLREVTSDGFLNDLKNSGCKAVIYVEYVPVTETDKALAPTDAERGYLLERLDEVRREYEGVVFIAFPGDEKRLSGCLAAGRGFFHINSHGGAEPCPFSPYSDINVKDTSLKEALSSPLFAALRDQHIILREHSGGCVLFEQKEAVEALLSNSG